MNENLQSSPLDQKDFWNSLQLDIITSNQKLSNEDYHSFIERSFMFSTFFLGCSPLEVSVLQKILNLKDYVYVILFEHTQQNKSEEAELLIDDLKLYSLIKKTLHNTYNTVGPLIMNRFSVVISHDTMIEEQEFMKESLSVCRGLISEIEDKFHVSLRAGIGSLQPFHSYYTSFIDALTCMRFNGINDNILNYLDIKGATPQQNIDYLEAQKRLVEAIRSRKTEAYDYFGILMEFIRDMSDEIKRNKILEFLVLTNYTVQLDSQAAVKNINYTTYLNQLTELKGNDLIEFAYQCFIYITSYVKPQNTIDYTNHIVKATREYLENHYSDDISLEDMAAQVNISPQYFSKLIKKTTGFNFIDWLSMLRVKKAKEFLTNSNLTVKEVCFMVGYKDPNYFSRIFKKRIGITPSEYVKTSSYLNNKS